MTRPLLALLALVACLLPALAPAQGVGGFVSPGPLAEDHADLDSILKCTSCHEPGAGVTPTRCMSCHERVEEQVQTNKGFHANLGDACATCHAETAHAGRHGPDSLAELPAPWFRGGPHDSTTAFCQSCHPAGALARISPHTSTARGEARDASCSACHSGVPLPGATPAEARLRLDPAATCATCHPGMPHHGAATHLGRPVPQGTDLVLDGSGRIACFTCHDVHRHGPTGRVDGKLARQAHEAARTTVWAGLPESIVFPGTDDDGAMLRRPLEDDALCVSCHTGDAW